MLHTFSMFRTATLLSDTAVSCSIRSPTTPLFTCDIASKLQLQEAVPPLPASWLTAAASVRSPVPSIYAWMAGGIFVKPYLSFDSVSPIPALMACCRAW
eukprot:6447907-Prymnesium_polylepis.2